MEGLRGATRSASRASAASVRLWRLCSPRRAVECGENATDRAALGCAAERVWRVQGLRGLSRLCVGFSGFRAHSCVELGSCVCECGNFSAVGCALVCCTSECGELKVLQTHTLVGPEAERHRSEIHRVWREHDRKTVGNGTKQAKPQRIRDYNCSAGGSECGPKVERVVVHTRGRSSSLGRSVETRRSDDLYTFPFEAIHLGLQNSITMLASSSSHAIAIRFYQPPHRGVQRCGLAHSVSASPDPPAATRALRSLGGGVNKRAPRTNSEPAAHRSGAGGAPGTAARHEQIRRPNAPPSRPGTARAATATCPGSRRAWAALSA